MRSRARLIVVCATAALALGSTASADPADRRASTELAVADGDELAEFERAFERAMAGLDRKFEAILGATTMDCASDGGFGEMETCVVRRDSTTAVARPSAPAGS